MERAQKSLSQPLSNPLSAGTAKIDKGFDEGFDKGHTAFTLLELLIAVSIFAMVLTAINGVFYGAMRLQSKSSRAVEESLPAQQTVALLKRDLQGIVAPGGVLGGSFQSGVSTASTIASTVPPGSTTFYTCTGVIDETSPWA